MAVSPTPVPPSVDRERDPEEMEFVIDQTVAITVLLSIARRLLPIAMPRITWD
jgi:hypothetical protein